MKKAKIALVSIVKSFPGTPDGELPALMLLGQMEIQNGESASNAEARKNNFLQAYKFYKRAHDFFPASPHAKFAALPRRAHRALHEAGARYYMWEGELDGHDDSEMLTARLVCDWSVTEADIARFVEIAKGA